MKKRFLLIDSENVQNRLFEIIESARKRDKVIVFYTVYHSGKLEEYLRSNKNKKNIEFVECIAGNNALDLQLMGVLSFLIHRHPKREFVVYSNDKGYKALVKHWQSRNVDVELINFLTPAVGEDAYEFKSPITVETGSGGKKGKRSRVSFSSAGKGLSSPGKKLPPKKKEESGTAVVEKTSIRREPSKNIPAEKPSPAAKKPEAKEAPVKTAAPEKTVSEPKRTRSEKPSQEAKQPEKKTAEPAQKSKPAAEAKPAPRVVVDALLIPSQGENKPEPKAKINNIVSAPEPKPEAVPAQPEKEAQPAPQAVQPAPEVKADAPVKKKRGRKSKAEKAAEEAAKAALAAQQEAEAEAAPAPAEAPSEEKPKTRRRKKVAEEKTEAAEEVKTAPAENEAPAPAEETEAVPEEKTEQEEAAKAPAMSEEEYVTEICRSVRSTDLALINRVLTVGFGSEAAKGYYARFKTDPDYREEMGKLYNYSKSERVLLLIRTALRRGGLDPERAGDVCRIIGEKGTANMQALYHSFIKDMPGNVSERQSAYKAVKPYLPITDSL